MLIRKKENEYFYLSFIVTFIESMIIKFYCMVEVTLIMNGHSIYCENYYYFNNFSFSNPNRSKQIIVFLFLYFTIHSR